MSSNGKAALQFAKYSTLCELYKPGGEPITKRGYDILRSRELNKGTAFSWEERKRLGLHGLVPPVTLSQELQARREMERLREQPSELHKYLQLDDLQDRDEKLFYRLLTENTMELLSIVYTPVVGAACQNFGRNYRRPKGLYITIDDNSVNEIYRILSNWPYKDVRAIVVTDGERILGLGDLGTHGMGIPVGKLALYVALGGMNPEWCLPIVLDVGTDNKELIADPYYIGLKRKRVRGEEYDSFIENFMDACVKRYGRKVLIQFEDFGKGNAHRLLDVLAPRYCMFNDDIQGTASVVVAGLLTCSRISGKKIADTKYLFLGGGAAATGVAELIICQMEQEGLSYEEACSHIYLINTGGLITRSREKSLDPRLVPYCKDLPEEKDLLKIVNTVKPNALIGVSTIANAFSDEVLKRMAELNERPIIFPLSNPIKNAECTAEAAYNCSKGSALFAAGSMFDPVTIDNKELKPGFCNNTHIFPGVALGVTVFQIGNIKSELFLIAAKVLADCLSEKDLNSEDLYPAIENGREHSIRIALAIAEESYKDGSAKLWPKPEDMETYLRLQTYNTDYENFTD